MRRVASDPVVGTTRREFTFRFLGLGAAAVLAGCRGKAAADSVTGESGTNNADSGGGDSGAADSVGGDSGTGACSVTPDEIAGPYPDKTGMIDNSAYYRADITEGKTGLPLALTFTVIDVAAGCIPVPGAIVEVWHCDKDGLYSEYAGEPTGPDQTGTTYLRGLQIADAAGKVTFTSIYPGWYPGRCTHIHMQVFRDASAAPAKTTQLCFPDATNTEVYTTATQFYPGGDNTTKNADDQCFSDGYTLEQAAMSGDATTGMTAALTIAV